MRVCVRKSDNKLIEMQSDARARTLIENALVAGYALADIEEREVDAASYAALIAAQPTPPEVAAELARRQAFRDDQARIDMLTRLKTASPAQISAFVDNNVTDIASARAMFKRILLAIALDARNGG